MSDRLLLVALVLSVSALGACIALGVLAYVDLYAPEAAE